MKGMGSVERVLVLGIVVVIVAILGIAVWGATDDESGALDTAATDGGAVVQSPLVSPEALPANITPPDPALVSTPMSEIDRLKALRDQRREELAGGATQQVPGVTTLTDGGSGAAPGALPQDGAPAPESPVAAVPAADAGVPLNHVAPVDAGAAAAPPVVIPAAQDTIYTVASGDSLWKIAHKHYGGGDVQAHIDAILAANPTLTETLKVGQKITLPAGVKADPARLPAEKQAAEIGARTYLVKDGDTLSTIAKKELGSAKRWNEIYDLNRARISDPARITVGMKLTLPQKN